MKKYKIWALLFANICYITYSKEYIFQVGIIELKDTLTKIENSLDRLSSKMELKEDRPRNLEQWNLLNLNSREKNRKSLLSLPAKQRDRTEP